MVNTIEMVALAVGAVGVLLGEAFLRRRKQNRVPKKRENLPLPKQKPVFLGHDQRWTPTYSPEQSADGKNSSAPERNKATELSRT